MAPLRVSPDPAGCAIEFSDPEFASAERDTLYYVRAYEPARPAVNGGSLRCEYDAEGRCVEIRPCAPGDDCLYDYAPRAWSSPIYVDYSPPSR